MLSQILLFAAATQVTNPQLPDPATPGRGNAALDVTHYHLHLRLEPERRYVTARAILTATLLAPVQRVELDFHNLLEVVATRIDGDEVSWSQGRHKLSLDLPEDHENKQLTAEVEYRGLLPQSPSQGEPVGLIHDGTTLVAYLEPDGAHHFFPCNDHPSDKATYDLEVEVPDGNLVAALGELVEQGAAEHPGYQRFHWRTRIPTATYLVALGAGPYVRLERVVKAAGPDMRAVPIIDYCEARDQERLAKSLSPVAEMLPWFEQQFGPYPFEKYGHVVTRNWVGGMEDQSLTVLGRADARLGDPGLLAHELAHQWFGDWVSPKQWGDVWLNEGWATYAEWLWFQEHDAESAARTLATWRRSTIRLAMRSHPHTLARPDPEALFDPDLVYNKGGMVLVVLDGLLGRERMLRGARAYLAEFGGANANSADFERVMSKAAGVDLKPFFDRWVRGNTIPEFKLEWSSSVVDGGWSTQIRIKQENGHHPMALALRLQGDEEQRIDLQVRVASELVEKEVVTDFHPQQVQLDPDKMLPWYPSTPNENE